VSSTVTPNLIFHDLRLRGTAVRCAEAGSGPPLLLVHGFLVNHKEWLPVLPWLAARFRCILPDLPGFGRSEKPSPAEFPYTREAFAEILAATLEHFELSSAHVVGHSLGGAVAMTFAADYPERVERLCVVDSASYPFPLPLKGRLPLLPGVGPVVFKVLYRRPLFRDYFRHDVWSGHAGLDLDRVDEYYDDFRSRPARNAAYAVLKRAATDLTTLVPKIPRVEAPTLVLWGDEDRIFPLSLAHRLARELPSAHLHVIEGSGHAPNEEHPDAVAAQLVRHLHPEEIDQPRSV
jgi:pimeloyl-ACP methyl ester carboxylesterase